MHEIQSAATAICSESEQLFRDLETYCMFVGYPRSGHSLIGSLLDAHPNMIFAHEVNVLKRIYEGLNEREIYHLLLENSETNAKAGRRAGRFSYSHEVPNQWQGRFRKLLVIGDKKGRGSTRYLSDYSDSLQRLRDTIALKIKFIHVVRNPYDNISSMAAINDWNLEENTKRYFSLCENVQDIKERIATNDLFELRHESIIDHPHVILKELCHFLGQDAPDDYLNDCASIVYKSPHRSRCDTRWDHRLIDIVKDRIAEFTFLRGYSFES